MDVQERERVADLGLTRMQWVTRGVHMALAVFVLLAALSGGTFDQRLGTGPALAVLAGLLGLTLLASRRWYPR